MRKWERRRRVARQWALEFWITLRYEPVKLVPHFCQPKWWASGGEYVCDRCGSSSERVQRRGLVQAIAEGEADGR